MKGVLLWGAVALAGVGCASARYVHQDANGGVVAMSSNSSGNREKAMKLIQDHVGPGYQIVEEREVVTGQSTTNHANTQKELTAHSELPFLPAEKQTTVTTTTTRDVTEWQIVYRRSGVSMPTPPLVNGVPVVQQTGAQGPAGKAGLDKPLPTGGMPGGIVTPTPAK
jgi:hypothetical protein